MLSKRLADPSNVLSIALLSVLAAIAGIGLINLVRTSGATAEANELQPTLHPPLPRRTDGTGGFRVTITVQPDHRLDHQSTALLMADLERALQQQWADREMWDRANYRWMDDRLKATIAVHDTEQSEEPVVLREREINRLAEILYPTDGGGE